MGADDHGWAVIIELGICVAIKEGDTRESGFLQEMVALRPVEKAVLEDINALLSR